MHILDFSYDELLEILKHVRVADIRAWIQTCRAFASLQDPHLVLPLQLLRLATEHDFSLDCLELPAGAVTAIESLVTRPQRFQDLLIKGSLSGQSLRRYRTNIDNEKVLEAKIVPGGRWLVTITSHPFGWMMCRVWDLDIAQEEIALVPAASTPLPPTRNRNAGQLWLQKGTEGHTTQILVYVEGLILIEFDHLDQERPLRLLGMVNIGHMDTSDSQGIGLHGDYVFDTTDRELTIVNWVTGREEVFKVERPTFIESNSHILSIGSEGLVLLDQLEQTIAFYGIPRTGHEAQDQPEGSQQKSKPTKTLSHIKQITIEGIVSYEEEEPSHWPPVNRPYSSRQQANAVIRFPQHLVYAEYPSNPRAADLDTLPLAFHLPPGTSEPAAYRRTIDGHVVGVSVREFDVHFLMKDGTQSVQSFEHDFGNNFTRKFVCPFGGVIGGFGLFQGADEIYLWRLDWSC